MKFTLCIVAGFIGITLMVILWPLTLHFPAVVLLQMLAGISGFRCIIRAERF